MIGLIAYDYRFQIYLAQMSVLPTISLRIYRQNGQTLVLSLLSYETFKEIKLSLVELINGRFKIVDGDQTPSILGDYTNIKLTLPDMLTINFYDPLQLISREMKYLQMYCEIGASYLNCCF